MRAPVLTHKRSKALRRALSLPEGLLWIALRRKSLGLRFRRQHALGPYILDYCPAARLAVEVDGACHADPDAVRHDQIRDAWLARHGVRVMTCPAAAILDDESIEILLQQIAEAALAPSAAFGGPPPLLRG